MGFLNRLFHRRREERQLLKATETPEAKRQSYQKERDYQQAEALRLALCKLQRTMDPLIAAQIYNKRCCPLISRLPEELLLCMIDFLCDDVAAIYCLRIVSRAFFRILGRSSVVWRKTCSVGGEVLRLDDATRLRFRRLLQRDGRCNSCRQWDDACENVLSDECKFQQNLRWSSITSTDVLLRNLLYNKLHCDPCQSFHDLCQFSSFYQQPLGDQTERRCLGQQGSVQLCEHVQITWARIRAHIDNWRQHHHGGDWQACFESFNIECHHASHDMRCTESEAPTWPRAHLSIGAYDSHIVVLNLEWKPHSRIDALTLTADGRIPAPELRASFQRLRDLGPADNLCPAPHVGALPEMAFFSPFSYAARCIYYMTGDDDRLGPLPSTFRPLPSDSLAYWRHGHGSGRNGKKLDIIPHYPSDAVDAVISSQCLKISYEKDIMICRTTALRDPAINIIPTDHWLHAMDTQTYPHPQADQIRPQCRNVACVNYYRRRNDFYTCSAWHHRELHRG